MLSLRRIGWLSPLLLLACAAPARDDAARSDTAAPPAAVAATTGTAEQVPRFEDFAVPDTFHATPAPVDLASDSLGRRFRTRLREGAAQGPNFAGSFTIVSWGCGTGCETHAVVDARTGRIYPQTITTSSGARYRLDSALFIANPPDPDAPPHCASCGQTAYYVWRGERFERQDSGFRIRDSEGTADNVTR
jgi:hypothetical protein